MRPEKQLLLDEIKESLDRSKAFILTSYQEMNPNVASDFRIQINESGGFFLVVRKRMFMKAAETLGLSFGKDDLKGHIGLVCAENDMVQTTKALFKFTEENQGMIDVLGGQFEGKSCSPQEINEISKLPSQDQMRAEFLGLLEAPLSQTLAVMDALLASPLHCLQNKIEKGETSVQ